MQVEARNRHAGIGEEQTLLVLVPAGLRGVGCVTLELQPFGDMRRDNRRVVIDTDDSVNRRFAREHVYIVRSALRVFEIERKQTGWIRGLEGAWPFRRDREVRADPPRSLHERRGAVGRGRQQQQKAWSYFLEAWK